MTTRNDPKLKAIRRQALWGLLIFAIGMATVVALVPGGDWSAIDQDPAPVMPGLLVAIAGACMIALARIRMIFHRPKILLRQGGKKLVQNLFEEFAG